MYHFQNVTGQFALTPTLYNISLLSQLSGHVSSNRVTHYPSVLKHGGTRFLTEVSSEAHLFLGLMNRLGMQYWYNSALVAGFTSKLASWLSILGMHTHIRFIVEVFVISDKCLEIFPWMYVIQANPGYYVITPIYAPRMAWRSRRSHYTDGKPEWCN
jgi:hypothetical protein